jgi:amidohydrolase
MISVNVDELNELGGGCHTCSEEDLNIHSEVLDDYNTMCLNRRWFHENAELSFEEYKTAERIVKLLKNIGIVDKDIYEGIGKTGVCAIIYGCAGDGPCIMLRADMDALPIQEAATGIEYTSKNAGCMHACGHDGHMASLICAAKILFNNKNNLRGSIKLCFQPAEEGRNGATAMIKDGLLEGEGGGKCGGPRVDYVYGIHLWSFNRLGEVMCSNGPVMAASDKFIIDVKGSGGHGAVPHKANDAIVSAANLVTSLQTIVSRNVDPLESGVVTVGTINGGFGYNIIADQVTIMGTARAFTKETQEKIKTRMVDICCGLGQMYNQNVNLDYQYGYPPTINAYPEEVEKVKKAASRVVGDKRSNLLQKTMGAEDFSFFLEERPGCFFFVGAAKRGEILPHHKSVFDFDERAMLVSASVFVELVNDILLHK